MNSQIIEILKYFFLNKVKYLTIGGFALNKCGYARNTGAIDIFIEDTFANSENLIITKKAANRPKDILDIEELEKINRKSDS